MDDRTSLDDTRDAVEPLLREVTGRVLRRHRHERGERLVETARRAGVSSQYLSELERGRKDASSELLAAVAGALGLTLLDLTREVTADLTRAAVPALRSVPGAIPMRSVGTSNQPVPQRCRGPVALAA
ncbi:helix-turn-helix domain-containing protein [Gordonia sp. DT30]|uniref:helix-turn-helix domain-containing protein n=1 Tax=unclassified Gordonia (in: high G+C Gram-positive bacteria) TaxID=2657482 RepID=UPI003CE7E145